MKLEKDAIKVIPDSKEPDVGIIQDSQDLADVVLASAQAGTLNTVEIESFESKARNRESLYNVLDMMAEDSTLSSVLDAYTEDSVAPNDSGKIVWAESQDGNIANYVNYLLDVLQVDKHIYSWAYCLIKYGDVYLKFYRESDYSKVFSLLKKKKDKSLKEDINVQITGKNDKLVPYLEMVDNPGEMFELSKFGKTAGFIRVPMKTQHRYDEDFMQLYGSYTPSMNYKFVKKDVDVYPPTEFVHAALIKGNTRNSEKIELYSSSSNMNSDKNSMEYSVKRGTSILQNSYRIWRQLSLLENAILLNRLTKSSVLRVAQVEVGDMPKPSVQLVLTNIKSLFEQKTAITANQGMREYVNPAPMENTVYLPTHNGHGTVSISTVGGDADVKGLADLDYFKNLLFGSLRVPKEFFGQGSDANGFDGGQTLAQTSSRYAKAINVIQNALIALISDAINIYLYDRAETQDYVGQFQIRMQRPTTKEVTDRQENVERSIRNIESFMGALSDIKDELTKLKVMNALLKPVINNEAVISEIQSYIEKQEKSKEKSDSNIESSDIDMSINDDELLDTEEIMEEELSGIRLEEDVLPTAEELGIDLLGEDDDK